MDQQWQVNLAIGDINLHPTNEYNEKTLTTEKLSKIIIDLLHRWVSFEKSKNQLTNEKEDFQMIKKIIYFIEDVKSEDLFVQVIFFKSICLC